jgi:murein DD-endopeptidase MepM/ murein hydrolase activator NlpD
MKKLFYQFLVILAVGTSAFGVDLLVQAQTADDLKIKISAKTDEIKKLEQEIKQYQGDLAVLGSKKKTLANSIAELNFLRKKLDTEIRITQAKVDASDLKIRQIGSQISYKDGEITSRPAALKEALGSIYERDAYSLPQIALSNESFSGIWDDIQTLDQFSGSIKQNIEILQGLKTDLESKKNDKQIEKNHGLSLKSELNDRKKIAEQARREQSTLLVQTNNQESTYKKILSQKIALKDAFEKELQDYETTLKFILDPSSIPPRGTKVFAPPLDDILITQQFGRTSASGRLYASGSHNGTDFRATMGTRVMAMGTGVVDGVGDTDVTCRGASFGKWVFIRYNNGLASTYGHLSLISVQKGDTVSAGTLVGYSGNTGYSTGPHLHVSVYAGSGVNVKSLPSKACDGRLYTMPIAAINAYLDPMDYL